MLSFVISRSNKEKRMSIRFTSERPANSQYSLPRIAISSITKKLN